MAANPEIVAYIRRAAIARNIDPDVAVRVAMTEGLNVFDPNRPDLGGDDRSSFGPFQLHYGGLSKKMPVKGLGDDFTKATGLHASDPKTWPQQVDFALDTAARNKSWSHWYGARDNGIPNNAGFGDTSKAMGVTLNYKPKSSGPPLGFMNTAPGNVAPTPNDIAVAQGAATEPGPYGNPGNLTTADSGAYPPAPATAAPAVTEGDTIASRLKGMLGGDLGKSLAKAAGPRSGEDQQLLPSGLGASMSADAGRMQAAQALMATILAGRKRRGVTLNTSAPSLEGFMG